LLAEVLEGGVVLVGAAWMAAIAVDGGRHHATSRKIEKSEEGTGGRSETRNQKLETRKGK